MDLFNTLISNPPFKLQECRRKKNREARQRKRQRQWEKSRGNPVLSLSAVSESEGPIGSESPVPSLPGASRDPVPGLVTPVDNDGAPQGDVSRGPGESQAQAGDRGSNLQTTPSTHTPPSRDRSSARDRGSSRSRGSRSKRGSSRGDRGSMRSRGSRGTQGSGNRGSGNRAPAEVFARGAPVAHLRMTKAGVGQTAVVEVTRVLFTVPEDYSVTAIVNAGPDTATTQACDTGSVEVVTRVLTGLGWTITSTPVWSRYELVTPVDMSTFEPEMIVRGLLVRNQSNGLPPGSLIFVNSATEGSSGNESGRPRTRIWIEASPEAETFLKQHDMLLRTVSGAVRLRPAPRSRHRSNRS